MRLAETGQGGYEGVNKRVRKHAKENTSATARVLMRFVLQLGSLYTLYIPLTESTASYLYPFRFWGSIAILCEALQGIHSDEGSV